MSPKNGCPDHFGARVECGQCYDSLRQHLSNARSQLAAVQAWADLNPLTSEVVSHVIATAPTPLLGPTPQVNR